jgi:hypothetical protein
MSLTGALRLAELWVGLGAVLEANDVAKLVLDCGIEQATIKASGARRQMFRRRVCGGPEFRRLVFLGEPDDGLAG